MRTLSIDIETYSSVNLKTCGLYKYVESPDFEVLMIAYAFDDEPVTCIDLINILEIDVEHIENFVHELRALLTDACLKKSAYNAAFEIACLSKMLGVKLPASQWECTMVLGAQAGYPFGLDFVSAILGTAPKDKAGSQLIDYFCKPCKATKTNGGRLRNLPEDAPDKWAAFLNYCIKDVEAERDIRNRLSWLPMADHEQQLWALDQDINSGGVKIDQRLIKNAIKAAEDNTQLLTAEAIELTGLSNPNSAAQLKKWLTEEMDEQFFAGTLRKDDIPALLENSPNDTVTRVLQIRQEMAKTSVKKYIKMLQSVCKDGTLKGLFQFCGANRTWRWAGRGTQVQNLPKNKEKQIEFVRECLLNNNIEGLKLFGAVPDLLSQLIRTAFVPSPGNELWVADFSAIEARVIAWIAGENWRLDVFKTHGKIYEASAAQMFKVDIEAVTKESDYRAKAKVAELALGYQGGVAALAKMDYSGELNPDEYEGIKNVWRAANKKIVSLWYRLQELALECVTTGRTTIFKIPNTDAQIKFVLRNDVFFMIIPGGSKLAYPQPRIRPGKFGEVLTYMGLDDKGKWKRLSTYGGKLTENAVQGVARNCLAFALQNVSDAAYNVVVHVHDEIVSDQNPLCGSLEEMCNIMSVSPPWALTLPLRADGFKTSFYKKD